jgi:hypothetical protein
LSVCLSVSGAFGKTWRKGKAKAAAEITRLLTLQEQGELQLLGGAGVASPAASLQAWVEPAGPRSLTVMELSEDLDNMAKTGNEIKKAVGSAGEKGSKGGGGGGAKKGGSGAAAGGSAGSAGRKKMLQVDEVMALVIGSLLASQ